MRVNSEVCTIVRYSLVGISSSVLFALMTWLFLMTGLSYPVYTALVYTLVIVFNFLMHSLFTFKMSPKKILTGLIVFKFLIVTLSLTGVVQVIQWVLIGQFGICELIGIGAGMLFYVSFSFFLHRFWVFKEIGVTKEG